MTNYRSDIFEQGEGYPDLTTRHFSAPASTVTAPIDIDRQRMDPCHVGKAEHWFRQCPATMSFGAAGDVGAEFKGRDPAIGRQT